MNATETDPVMETEQEKPRIKWSYEERDMILRRCCEKLADAEFKSETWDIDKDRQRDKVEELFMAAQIEIVPEKIRPRTGQSFSQRYFVILPHIQSMLASILTERRMIASRGGQTVEAAMNGHGVPEGSSAVPDLAHFPGGAKPEESPTIEIAGQRHVIEVKVGITADIADRLRQQEIENALVIDEMKKIRDRLLIHEQRLNDLDSRPVNDANGGIKRIAFVGRHRSQFLKIQADLRDMNFPIRLFFVDCEKSPTKLFADFAILTSEVPHKWSFKITNDLGKDRFVMGSTSSDRVRDTIKMFLSET